MKQMTWHFYLAGTTIASCLLFALFVAGVRCSLYDPHLFPTSGPYFEGWYFRFIDFTNRRSFATLFGKVLPKEVRQYSTVFIHLLGGALFNLGNGAIYRTTKKGRGAVVDPMLLVRLVWSIKHFNESSTVAEWKRFYKNHLLEIFRPTKKREVFGIHDH